MSDEPQEAVPEMRPPASAPSAELPAPLADRGMVGVSGGEGQTGPTAQDHMVVIAAKRSLDELMAADPATLAPGDIAEVVAYARLERANWHQAEKDRANRKIEKDTKALKKAETVAAKRRQELVGVLDTPMEV